MSYNYSDVMQMIGNCRAVIVTLNDNTQMLCEILSLRATTAMKVKVNNQENIIKLDNIADIIQLSC